MHLKSKDLITIEDIVDQYLDDVVDSGYDVMEDRRQYGDPTDHKNSTNMYLRTFEGSGIKINFYMDKHNPPQKDIFLTYLEFKKKFDDEIHSVSNQDLFSGKELIESLVNRTYELNTQFVKDAKSIDLIQRISLLTNYVLDSFHGGSINMGKKHYLTLSFRND